MNARERAQRPWEAHPAKDREALLARMLDDHPPRMMQMADFAQILADSAFDAMDAHYAQVPRYEGPGGWASEAQPEEPIAPRGPVVRFKRPPWPDVAALRAALHATRSQGIGQPAMPDTSTEIKGPR